MNQRLIGQDATPNATAINNSALLNLTLPTGSASLPATDTGGTAAAITTNGVTVGSGNMMRGLTITTTGAHTKLTGNAFGTLTLGDVSLVGTGKALDLTDGTLAIPAGVTNSFTGIQSTSSPDQGVDLATVAGSLNVGSGGTQISNSTNEGILLTSCSATINFGGGSIASVTGTSFSVSGGTVSVTYSGDITKNNAGTMVSVSGGHNNGTLIFQTGTLSATTASAGNGLQFNNADGAYNFNGTTTLNGGDAGIDIIGGSGGTFSFNGNTSINNPSGIAYNEDTSTANVTYSGTLTQNNANNAVNINAKTGGTTSFIGAITASTTTANAIDLTSNTGGAINFNGMLSLTTTSGVAFNATGGGTVTATKNDGTVAFVRLDASGAGYTSVPAVMLSGAGSGATATATLGVGSVGVGAGGSGYTTMPTVTLSGGGGSGAVARAVIAGGAISAINVINPGTGYNLSAYCEHHRRQRERRDCYHSSQSPVCKSHCCGGWLYLRANCHI